VCISLNLSPELISIAALFHFFPPNQSCSSPRKCSSSASSVASCKDRTCVASCKDRTCVASCKERCALPQHPCKTLCPCIVDRIAAEIEVSQRSALRQHSCKTLCPVLPVWCHCSTAAKLSVPPGPMPLLPRLR
jgi:hypothetical protein